jgi:hypothetical protein
MGRFPTACPDCQAPLVGHCRGRDNKCMQAICTRCGSYGYPATRWYSPSRGMAYNPSQEKAA